ncbi:MAG: hypothetical protein HQL90_06460 [Magnetococcales bacterium]|nr:hypothetical protein [Magnetococcales bacterium]
MSSPTTVQAVGIAWYRREDYQALLAIFSDADKLPSSYDDWLKSAENLLKHLDASGTRAVKANIDPNDFPVWCRTRNLDIDASARKRFANEVAASVIKREMGSH